jgi:hypothetical protein
MTTLINKVNFKQITKGCIEFNGIDSLNGNQMSGMIIYQPLDVKRNQVWHIKFYDENKSLNNSSIAYFGSSAKNCKQWLSN